MHVAVFRTFQLPLMRQVRATATVDSTAGNGSAYGDVSTPPVRSSTVTLAIGLDGAFRRMRHSITGGRIVHLHDSDATTITQVVVLIDSRIRLIARRATVDDGTVEFRIRSGLRLRVRH